MKLFCNEIVLRLLLLLLFIIIIYYYYECWVYTVVYIRLLCFYFYLHSLWFYCIITSRGEIATLCVDIFLFISHCKNYSALIGVDTATLLIEGNTFRTSLWTVKCCEYSCNCELNQAHRELQQGPGKHYRGAPSPPFCMSWDRGNVGRGVPSPSD